MSHEHPHEHVHPAPELHNSGAGEGAVMLDIGNGVGALVLYAGASAIGLEIEISPHGSDTARTHVAVLPRPSGVHAAVYPTLAAGTWNLWHPDGDLALSVDIRDGEVTEAHWAG